jgi:hypothetical protein
MERPRPIGVCALCLRTAELCDSHLIPKSLYRVARAADHRAHPDPVLLTSAVRRQTSFQATQYLLCAAAGGMGWYNRFVLGICIADILA